MRQVTLCLLVKNNQVLLALKKRGFGIGKWNGIGGKLKENEDIKAAAMRELKEEIGVIALADNLKPVGDLKFLFSENPDWNQNMKIFLIDNWQGEPRESEEMAPQWYNFADVPYNKMWWDDKHWLPQVLQGKKVSGEFHFIKEGADCEKWEIKEI